MGSVRMGLRLGLAAAACLGAMAAGMPARAQGPISFICSAQEDYCQALVNAYEKEARR